MSSLLCLLNLHNIWPQDGPEFNHRAAGHFLSVNQTSKLLVWRSAHSSAIEHRQRCDYFLAIIFFFSVSALTPITRDAKDQVCVSS